MNSISLSLLNDHAGFLHAESRLSRLNKLHVDFLQLLRHTIRGSSLLNSSGQDTSMRKLSLALSLLVLLIGTMYVSAQTAPAAAAPPAAQAPDNMPKIGDLAPTFKL